MPVPPDRPPPAQPEPRASVLLVDDDAANLLALEALLDGLGLDLVRARSGAEALARFDDQPFALILLDLYMPGLDGFQTARLIRARDQGEHTPIIFVTGRSPDEFPIVEAYQLGAVDYLLKPLVPEILRAKVVGLVELYAEKQRARRQAEHFRLLVAGVKDYAIFMLDPDGRIATWNAGAERIKRYAADEIIGRHFSVFYPRDAIERDWPGEELRRAVADGRFEDEGWRLRKDGTRFWANVVITALRDETGTLRGFSKVTRDLTEQKKAEDALRQLHGELERRVRDRTADLSAANEALREADRRKDEFLAMLAHELRNPLAPIRTGLQVLSLPQADRTATDKVRGMMVRQIQHMGRIVDDLLDVSRIQQRKVTLRRERLDLVRLVRLAVEDHQPSFEADGVALTLDAPADPVWIHGDATRLSQVVGNLLHNSLKFTDPGGTVAVQVAADPNGRAAVAVRDTGVGIEPDMLGRLFEPFAQADRSLARSKGGLGLGLALVMGLTELHGGRVWAASAGPGRGAEFVVELPVQAEPAPVPPPVIPPPDRARLRVLVVEDNKDAADSLRVLLELFGYTVEVAYTGSAGVEAATRWQPDVILCDIGLPGLDGYAVADQLRQNPATAQARLIALTGYGTDEDRRKSREAGFDAHLTKPADPAALRALLNRGGRK